jgi:hypothetical protein
MKRSKKFLARCINPASPAWDYSIYKGDVQLEAGSAADARNLLAAIYANPAKVAAADAAGSIPWQDQNIVEIKEISNFDPAIRIEVVTAP